MSPKTGLENEALGWQRKNNSRLRRLLSCLVLLSAATILSILLPTPWSLISNNFVRPVIQRQTDPASEWKDDIWPLRQQTPWDISTDYPYPRLLEYDVTEGTWLRLDVHPVSGDIIFDMVGDIYCIPGEEAFGARSKVEKLRARPVILGVPHDSDPHFSPQGDRFVFRSDAGLGVENIWVAEWRGCDAMDVRAEQSADDDLRNALRSTKYDEDLLAQGIAETTERKYNRLLREGRAQAHMVTNETYRWVSDARFHPSGSKVIATKWYTSTRSLGAGEGWEYEVPSLDSLRHRQTPIEAGSGSRVLGRSLPPGWTADDYEQQQIGPEQLMWSGEDSIIFSKNVRDANTFEYSKDVHSGIYSIFQRNLTTGRTATLVDAFPGGASRPELSRDGRTLAFVRRVRDKEALVLKDLHTGTIHHIWHGLSYDLTPISAPMGTYPSFAFTPSDDAVVIWAAGQIYKVPLMVNDQGERVASFEQPMIIPFVAHIEKRLANTLRDNFEVLEQETQDTQRIYAFRALRVDDDGQRAVFEGAGMTYVQDINSKRTREVPVVHTNAPYYSPSFVHGRKEFILHARWSETNFTSFELANLETEAAYEIKGIPFGRYFSPVLCECLGSQRQIAFVKSSGDVLTGDVVATANPGLYIGNLRLPSNTDDKVVVHDLRYIRSEINSDDVVNLRFADGNKRLIIQQSDRAFAIELQQGANENGEYVHTTLASGRMSAELVVSPTMKQNVPEYVAFVDFFHVYIAPGVSVKDGRPAWSKPGNATERLARLSVDGGHDITWSRDGKKIFWFLGPFLHSLEVSKLQSCSSEIQHDSINFGISCVKKLLEYQEVVAKHTTDIARLKKEAASMKPVRQEWFDHQNSDVLVITNATLLTMATGKMDDDLIHDGVMVTRGGVIESVGPASSVQIPARARVIDVHGGYVIPGFIDVHAHWSGFSVRYPTKSWELETFLAYGVTTLHNPSADNVDGFAERSRVERGQLIGPRIFTVGDIIYGAGSPVIHQEIVSQEEAYSALIRIKAEGGPSSISYKNYNLPSRASRQRLLLAARNLTMLCVPEGGMNYDWDLTYIIDGMTTVEHAIPIPALYDDVLTLYALSGTGSTPTHIVNYGGAFGEQLVWATHDTPNDPKLRRFTRHDILEGLSESTARPVNSYAVFNTSISVTKMVEKGLLTHIGAHGEPPLGLNYHAEMWFASRGGLSNYEVIRAATASGAHTLGLFSSLGSLSQGKLADYLIYPPGVDLLNDNISKTTSLVYVARGGRLWDATSMKEVWPVKGRAQVMPPVNAE